MQTYCSAIAFMISDFVIMPTNFDFLTTGSPLMLYFIMSTMACFTSSSRYRDFVSMDPFCSHYSKIGILSHQLNLFLRKGFLIMIVLES